MQGYGNILASSVGTPGAALASSAAQTSILHQTMKWAMPARFFRQYSAGLGAQIRWDLAGIMSTLVTSPGTLTLVAKIGSVAVFTSQALPLNIVAKTNVPWRVTLDLEVTTEGSAAVLSGDGYFTSEAYINTAVLATGPAPGLTPMPAAGYSAGTAFDESTPADWDFFATWSVSNAANSIQCKRSKIFLLN